MLLCYVNLHTTFLPLCLHKVPQPCQLLGKAESCRHYTTNILFCTLQSGSMNREPGCAAAQRRFEFLPSPLRYSHIYLTFNLNLFTVVEEGGEWHAVASRRAPPFVFHSRFLQVRLGSAQARNCRKPSHATKVPHPFLVETNDAHTLSFDDLTLPLSLYPFSSENFSLVVQLERRRGTTRTRRGTGTCVWIFPATAHTRCSTVPPIT